MSWANELYAVYDKALTLESESVVPLPVSHSTAKAQLEITIGIDGNFLDAKAIENNSDTETIIPVTEDSGARSSGICPHPFADKLIYIAGDYCEHCNAKKGDEDKFKAYIEQLRQWKNSEYSHPSVNALYTYLSKKTLIKDLIAARVFFADESGILTSDKVNKIAQSDCFARFKINGVAEERTWCDRTLYDKFIAYNSSIQTEKSFCYATGTQTFCTYKHPSKLLNAGDKGKLFSANDSEGFSYRGRFLDKEQAVSIGYEFSQKMHNGLKWLITRQGVHFGNLTLIAWNSMLSKLPDICGDSQSIISEDFDDLDWDLDPLPETFTNYEENIRKAIFCKTVDGEKSELDIAQKVMILALDEATTGRVSVTMYSELFGSEFYENVNNWHKNTAWNRYDFTKKKNYIGSFPLPMIVEFAYGSEQNGRVVCNSDKLKGSVIARLIPCVTEGRNLPTDILRQLVNRTSRRTAYDKTWSTLLEITCGMIRKSIIEKGEDCDMGLDENCPDRNYLFGRLLALAEVAERSAYRDGEERPTNAERYFEKFSNAPAATWKIIRGRLEPYLERMAVGKRMFYKKAIDEVQLKFTVEGFNNSRLEPLYLLGYSHQRYELRYGKNNKNDNSEEV